MKDQGELFPDAPPDVRAERSFLLNGGPARVANRDGSNTGRIMIDAGDASRRAAATVNVNTQRGAILAAMRRRPEGITSIECVAFMPRNRHGLPQSTNLASTRLGELWEAGAATILRQRGSCVLGECHPHDKPYAVHRPTMECDTHGKPLLRNGASIWIAL
jgi:hypothetical protein